MQTNSSIPTEIRERITQIVNQCIKIKPLLVIKCITYNHEAYIREALEGFVKQKTTFPFVVIVHDDASTDKTSEIIREYAKQYPDIILPILETENQYSKGNGSLGAIMNACNAVNAKYLAFCEGDDYWTDPLKIQKQVDFMESHPDYVLIHSRFDCKEGTRIISKDRSYPSGDVLDKLLSNQYDIGTLTVVLRFSVFKKIPRLYREFHVLMGDLPLWIELSTMGKIQFLDEKTAVYRVLPESASHSRDIKKRIKFIENAYFIREFYANKLNRCNNIDFYKLRNYSILKIAINYQDRRQASTVIQNLKDKGYKIPLKVRVIAILMKLGVPVGLIIKYRHYIKTSFN